MFLTENISIGDAAIAAVLGYAVVFLGIYLLMAAVILMGKFFTSKSHKPASQVPTPAPAAASVAPAAKPLAPGSAGELKIYDVEPKTAAMIMALTAYKMGKPLNELRFISIKEVK